MIFQVYLIPIVNLSWIDDFCIEIVGCFDLAVAPPAGFPDHPHRGSAFIPSISFFVCKIIHVHES